MSGSPPAPLVVFSAWLVPGGGHFVLGRRTQAAVLFLTITATFFGGMCLADFSNVSPDRHGYYFIAHAMNGAETLVATLATRDAVEDHVPRHFGMATGEIGTLYTAVAALLNVIAMMDAYGIVARVKREEPAQASEEAAA
jgi:hypothetical protein